MSYLTEKMAYIRGLAEGLDIDETTKEGKLLLAIVEALSDTADEILEIEEIQDDIQAQLDEVDEDLADVEEIIYDEDDDCDCDCDCCEEDAFEVVCPACDEVIYIDEDILEDGSIECPNCGEKLEFDFDCDCDCDCGCED